MRATTVERTSAPQVASLALFESGVATLIMTNVTILQMGCLPLFVRFGSAQPQLALREVAVQTAEGCDPATFGTAVSDPYEDVQNLRCSDTFTTADRQQAGICAAKATCLDVPIASGASLTAARCWCTDPAYPNPELPVEYAAYDAFGGCLVPRRAQELVYTSTSVQASLQKPEDASLSLNVTLRLTGTDRAAIVWRVTNVDDLPSWIQLPRTAQSIADDAQVVQIPIVLLASGQRERAQVYRDSLIIAVSSYAIETVIEVRV